MESCDKRDETEYHVQFYSRYATTCFRFINMSQFVESRKINDASGG